MEEPSTERAAPDEAALSRRRELSRGTGELAVLALLDSGERYGFELLKVLRAAGVVEMKEGTLYPLLHRLEDAGYVTARWMAEGRRKPRKYYAITPAGEEHMAALRAEWTMLVEAMSRLLDAHAVTA